MPEKPQRKTLPMSDNVDGEVPQKGWIESLLESLEMVQWDRFVRAEDDKLGVYFDIYGWIDRDEDAYKDFILLRVFPETDENLRMFTTSSDYYHDEINEILFGDTSESNHCQRVEHTFEVPNVVEIDEPELTTDGGRVEDADETDQYRDTRTGERDVDRQTYVKIETLWSDTTDEGCRVCGRDVSSPFRLYCSRYCKNVSETLYRLFNWDSIRRWVTERDNRTCVRCGTASEDLPEGVHLEVDHIEPISKGGHPFDPRNLQTLCQPCHGQKGTDEVDYRGDEYVEPAYSEAPSQDRMAQSALGEFTEIEPDAPLHERLEILAPIDGGIELHAEGDRVTEVIGEPRRLTKVGTNTVRLKTGTGPDTSSWDWEVTAPQNGEPYLQKVDPDQRAEAYMKTKKTRMRGMDIRVFGVDAEAWLRLRRQRRDMDESGDS